MKPILSGVYLLFLGNDVVYVGQSADIYRRIYEHSSGRAKGEKKHFSSWEYIEIEDEESRVDTESLLIKLFKPKYNIDKDNRSWKRFHASSDTEKIALNVKVKSEMFLEMKNSVSTGDLDLFFGFPYGTFLQMVRDGKVPSGQITGDFFPRIRYGWIAEHFDKLLDISKANKERKQEVI